ncbi:hypothetical protein ALC62_04549 [Cyphomyrmex costatus]|uniref:Uncharacterized protein n=1 Tax=Cyphomyrmex costatus TaxID=456900 RepID=A0A195CV47_9HYME|nr:hypothetical protein ALC62_04549 [Cyphomyrmex costatus]
MELEVVGAVNVRRLMVCTPAIKSLEQRTEIKGKENRRVRRTGGDVGGGDGGGQRGEVGERTMRRGSYACTHTAANTGETGLRNDFTGITPAKSGRYGAAKCDVVIRHSRGLRCPRLPGRPAACRLARAFSSPHAQVLGSTSVPSRWSKAMIARKYFWIGIKFGTFPWGGPREHGDIPSRLQGLRGD